MKSSLIINIHPKLEQILLTHVLLSWKISKIFVFSSWIFLLFPIRKHTPKSLTKQPFWFPHSRCSNHFYLSFFCLKSFLNFLWQKFPFIRFWLALWQSFQLISLLKLFFLSFCFFIVKILKLSRNFFPFHFQNEIPISLILFVVIKHFLQSLSLWLLPCSHKFVWWDPCACRYEPTSKSSLSN